MRSKKTWSFKILMTLVFSVLTSSYLFSQTTFSPTLLVDSISHVDQFQVTDLNNDNDFDFVISTFEESTTPRGLHYDFKTYVLIHQNDDFIPGEFMFNTYGGPDDPLYFEIYDQQFKDVDGDNDIDVITSSAMKSDGVLAKSLQIHENLGAGKFKFNVIAQKEFGESFGKPLIVDLDNDLTQDILISRIGKTFRYLFEDDNYDNYELTDTIFNGQFDYLYSGDINTDNKQDLIVLNQSALFWFEQLGNGIFNLTPTLINANLITDSLLLFDLDNDNDIDIISINYSSGISYLRNIGNGSFDPPNLLIPFNLVISAINVEVADLDSDNDFDIIYSNPEEGLQWALNNGLNDFDTTISISPNLTNYFQTIDFDADGDLDIVSAEKSDIILFRNDLLTTSIQENSAAKFNVSIFPNPTKSNIQIDLKSISKYPVDIIIRNEIGQLMKTISNQKSNLLSINSSNWPTGTYFVYFYASSHQKLLGNTPFVIQ